MTTHSPNDSHLRNASIVFSVLMAIQALTLPGGLIGYAVLCTAVLWSLYAACYFHEQRAKIWDAHAWCGSEQRAHDLLRIQHEETKREFRIVQAELARLKATTTTATLLHFPPKPSGPPSLRIPGQREGGAS